MKAFEESAMKQGFKVLVTFKTVESEVRAVEAEVFKVFS
jgi:hypothetical protein